MNVVLIINLCASLYLAGLIWTIQLVHYPGFNYISKKSFKDFHRMHTRGMGLIVAIPMIAELASSILLAIRFQSVFFYINLTLVILTWVCTGLLSVPKHRRLQHGKDKNVIKELILTNYSRTALWTIRSFLIVGYFLSMESSLLKQ